MGKRLVITGPRTTGFEDYPDPALAPDQVRVSTLYSGISAGTELTSYRGTNPYMAKKWDRKNRLFLPAPKDQTSWSYPLNTGYEQSGRVVEVGKDVEGVAVGDIVFGSWGHKTLHILEGAGARAQLFPSELDPMLGAFMGIAPTALNAILDAEIRVSETVVVFGQGAVGQMITQLARLNGGNVIAVDLVPARLALAKKLGAAMTINPRENPVGETVKELTGGRGADVCIEASGFDAALHEAIRTVAYSGKVIAVGFYQRSAGNLYLGEEFHHNRINIVGSQIYGVNPSLTYRWNNARLEQAIIELLKKGVLDLRGIVTHIVPFAEGPRAFELADAHQDEAVQVMIEF